jgi:hypothetical protein
MSKKEKRIEEEVRRRAFERVNELDAMKEQQVRQEANLEAIEMVAELPREEIERIDKEVRDEFLARQNRYKVLLASIILFVVITLCVMFFVVRQPNTNVASKSILPKPGNSQMPTTLPMPKKQIQSDEKDPVIPEQTGQILTKVEAEKVLKEPLLDCLRESENYSMIVRIGQGYKAPSQGPLPPLLIFNNEATINYRVVKNFTSIPLGKCVANAALGVRTRAFKGNYMRFAITNEKVPDPLANAPKTINHKMAQLALSAFDEEARECAIRYPQYAESGKTISFSINFRGVDGSVTQVLPFYVNESLYRTCLEKTYQKTTVTPFRRLSTKVVHRLTP